METIYFIVIGAQKSGTTTLFQLLSEHPQIYVPPGKEVPFFTRKSTSPETLSAYIREHFGSAPKEALLGKVTPHYLSDPRVSSRIRALLPDIKLIVILRDPVERAFSHYRMSVRRGLETRNFEQAIDDQLRREDVAITRQLPTGEANEHRTYVAWGEYGRLLSSYSDWLMLDKMLILFTQDLEANPSETIEKMLTFLCLPMLPLPSLGRKLHRSGDRERLPILHVLRRFAPLRDIWRIVPPRYRSRILFGFNQWNVVPSDKSINCLSPNTVERLYEHYSVDTDSFVKLTGLVPPWVGQL